MRRSLSRRVRSLLGSLAVVIAVTPLLACENLSSLTMMISEFDTSDVRSVTVWRLDAESGQYEQLTQYEFLEVFYYDGQEYMTYSLVDQRFGAGGPPLATPVTRSGEEGDDVVVTLAVVTHGRSMEVRATTRNGAGESDLSAESLQL